MSHLRIAVRLLPLLVLLAAMSGCAGSAAAPPREPRDTSVLTSPRLDTSRVAAAAPAQASPASRLERLRQ